VRGNPRFPLTHPKKHLGQNFLNNKLTLQKIITAADLTDRDHIIEVGPGKGFLTKKLLEKAKKVTAIEKDSDLIPILEEKFPKLNLIHEDALTFKPPKKYKLVANIPYYITSPLINHFLKNQKNKPELMVLMVQKEVATKALAKPGDLSVLALNIQTFAEVKKVTRVPASHFSPKPKVDSAVIKITPYKKPLVPDKLLPAYFQLISDAFSQKRKMIRSTLPKEIIEKTGIDPTSRPQELTIENWKELAQAAKSHL